MSDESFGGPPGPGAPGEPPQGGGWQQVNVTPPPANYGGGYPPPPQQPPPPGYAAGQYPPPGQPYPPPPPGYAAGQYPPPPAGQYPPGYQPPPGYPPPGYTGQPASAGLTPNSAAALSYVTFIPAVIFLVMEPYNRNPFVRFNAWQCIVLTLVWVVVSIAFVFLGFVHFFGLFFLLHTLIRLALFVLWLVAIIKASKGEFFKIPLVGDLAEQFAGKV